MGFSDYFVNSVTTNPNSSSSSEAPSSTTTKGVSTYSRDDLMRRLPDQEILDGIESIYYEENANVENFELRVSFKAFKPLKQRCVLIVSFLFFSHVKKFSETKLDYGTVEHAMMLLKQQHKVISKTVLQNILEQTTACNTECEQLNEVIN